jgi:hypothetical protein
MHAWDMRRPDEGKAKDFIMGEAELSWPKI